MHVRQKKMYFYRRLAPLETFFFAFFSPPQTFFFAFWAKFTRYTTLTGRSACCPRTFACRPRTFACCPREVRKICENEALFRDFGKKKWKKKSPPTHLFFRATVTKHFFLCLSNISDVLYVENNIENFRIPIFQVHDIMCASAFLLEILDEEPTLNWKICALFYIHNN